LHYHTHSNYPNILIIQTALFNLPEFIEYVILEQWAATCRTLHRGMAGDEAQSSPSLWVFMAATPRD